MKKKDTKENRKKKEDEKRFYRQHNDDKKLESNILSLSFSLSPRQNRTRESRRKKTIFNNITKREHLFFFFTLIFEAGNVI